MINFQGSRADFGKFYGERLRSNGHDFYRDIPNDSTYTRQLHLYQKYYPELITERLAAAEVLGLDPQFLFYEDFASFVDAGRRRVNRHTHGCTIFALHENSKTYVGRNYDWLPEAREFFEQYNLNITGAYRYFAFSDESVWRYHTGKNTRKFYAEDAINEHGLYIGLTYSHIDKWNYGLSPSHFIRYIAEKCRTTRQALNVFNKIPCAIPKNFLIADANGNLAVVEHSSRSYAIVKPDAKNVLVKTNHILSPKLITQDKLLTHNDRSTSFVRYAEAHYLISKQLPNYNFTDTARILRDSHYVYNQETIWSLALELSEQRFNLYYDTAMGQKQKKFSFLND